MPYTALDAAGIPFSNDLVVALPHTRTVANVHQATTALLSRQDRPTAIFAAANTDTLGVTRALHDLGLAQRVGQIVFDDIDFADMLTPPLSAYSQDPVELGRLCGQAILRRAAATAPEPRFQTLPGRLVARGSGEIAPQ